MQNVSQSSRAGKSRQVVAFFSVVVVVVAVINAVIVLAESVNKPLWNSRTVHLQEYHTYTPTAPESFFGMYWSERVELLSDTSYAMYPVSRSTCYANTAAADTPDYLSKYKTKLTLCSPNVWHEQATCATSDEYVDSLLKTYAQVTDMTFDSTVTKNWKLPSDDAKRANNVNRCVFSKLKPVMAFDVDSHSLSVLAAGNFHVYLMTLLTLIVIVYLNVAIRMIKGYTDLATWPINLALILVYLYLFFTWNSSSSSDEYDLKEIDIGSTGVDCLTHPSTEGCGKQKYYTNSDKCFGGIFFSSFALSLFYMMTYHSPEDTERDDRIYTQAMSMATVTNSASDTEQGGATKPTDLKTPMTTAGYITIYPEVTNELRALLDSGDTKPDVSNEPIRLLSAVEQYRFSYVFIIAIPLYVMTAMSTTKHTLDMSLQTALIGAVLFGVTQYLFMNFTWAVSLILPEANKAPGLFWIVTLGHGFIFALTSAIQSIVIVMVSAILPGYSEMVQVCPVIFLSAIVVTNLLQSIACWTRSQWGAMMSLSLQLLVLAVFVFVFGFGVRSHYSEVRGTPQMVPDAAGAADLVKRFWLYGLRVQLPDNQRLSYTNWDSR